MLQGNVIIRFNKVSFEYGKKPILNEADFSVREGAKITLMGQNGAGKSTIFQLIVGNLKPESGAVLVAKDLTMATARQVIGRDEIGLTVREFFEKAFTKKVYDIEPRINKILDVVHLSVSQDKILKTLSGGQQARLLLGQALIQNPDILLLDEPTNHINFRHIPVIAKALDRYEGAMILMSHVPDFVKQIKIDQVLDLML